MDTRESNIEATFLKMIHSKHAMFYNAVTVATKCWAITLLMEVCICIALNHFNINLFDATAEKPD